VTSTTTGLPDRYRPLDQVAPDEETATGVIRSWRARDRVLNRDVALRVHTPGGSAAREWITRALTAGGLSTPALAMVYDAAEGTGGGEAGGAAYVVNEWLEGSTLRDRLAAGGPLPEREARTLIRRLAEGVAEAHRVGLAVGGLTPDHVVLRAGGMVGLLSVPAATGTVQGDIAALGALLELCLTGRTTDGTEAPAISSPDLAALVRRARSTDPGNRLSSAATMVVLLGDTARTGPQDMARSDSDTDSGWLRRLRDRRELAELTGGDDGSAGGAHRSDDAAGREPHRDSGPRDAGPPGGADRTGAVPIGRAPLPPVPASTPRRPATGGGGSTAARTDGAPEDLDWSSTFAVADEDAVEDAPEVAARRRLAVIGLPLLALAVVVAFALWLGKNVLSVASSVDDVPGSVPPVTAPSSAPADSSAPAEPTAPSVGGPVAVAGSEVFNPFGDGEPENDDDVPSSHDGDPASAWSTVTYRGSAAFGNLKAGVGVRYDLGGPKELAGVAVQTGTPGATVEVRTGDGSGASLDSYPVAATGQLTGNDELRFDAPVTARYVLVWVTGLVPTGEGFSAELAEVAPLAVG
jgi:putative peptidoglycan lipid II flippase